MDNFLILTPDGVGSTYLQRALTVYLNAYGLKYFNTHELLNGIELTEENNLIKVVKGYRQSLDEISNLITFTKSNLVSRIAEYHVTNRLTGNRIIPPKGYTARPLEDNIIERNKKENYQEFYKLCKEKFDTIIYCTRDPFEYAVSWSIRDITNVLNVYSIKEKIQTHSNQTYDVNIEFFQDKLDQYKRYLYWVQDNFTNAIEVKYDDLHVNPEYILRNITGLDYSIKHDFNITFEEYSSILYNLSQYYETENIIYFPEKNKVESLDKLRQFQLKLLEEKKLYSVMPHKMNTLLDKRRKVKNFDNILDLYNNWANNSNQFNSISHNDLSQRIDTENKIYR